MPENLDSLRAEVRRLRRATTRKVSRIHVKTGIAMSGSGADPRRKASVEKDLSESALRDYAHRLAGFLDRAVQFVPDARRRPMPRAEWLTYKSLEERWNQRVDERVSSIRNIRMPSGRTIAEQDAMMHPPVPGLVNPAANAPREINRKSTAFDASRLGELTEQMRRRLEPGYFESMSDDNRETFRKMIDIVGDAELQNDVDSLSADQFDVLWQWSPFTAALAMQYEMAMHTLLEERQRNNVYNLAAQEISRYVEWAQELEL